MALSGYSGTPLLKKLGITPQMKISLINAPDNYQELLETDLTSQIAQKNDKVDFAHLFTRSNREFEKEMKKLAPLYKANPLTIIWISWYKKTSGIATDITEDIIRKYALANDLVDIKVCAVSDQWSGLKLVVQKAKR